MALAQSVILLEFNELCPALMQRFMQAGKLPNFQRLYWESEIYTTDAEEQPPYLEPWIQWVTVHSGLSYREHQIFYLDEGHKLTVPSIWDILSQAGYRVWVCGSMNAYYQPPLNGYFLPDYWSTQQTPYPAELSAFHNLVSRYVQEYTNDAVPLTWQDYQRFLTFMLKHGLSTTTARAILRQLWQEQRTKRYRWQRATILDKLQWDLFCWYYRRFKPHFSTFFLNSTAHFQHLYWRNLEPEQFQVQPSEEQAEYETAILYGYQEMDKIVGQCLQLVDAQTDTQTTVMLCTALSQQPCLTYETIGGKHLYRPRKFAELLSFAGITAAYTCSPVMAEEFFIRFENESDASTAEQRLAALQINGRSAIRLRRQETEIYAGCGIFDPISESAVLTIDGGSASVPFFQIFYPLEDIKSGMHHPDGILWVRHPICRHAIHSTKLSLQSIKPMILNILPVSTSGFDQAHLINLVH